MSSANYEIILQDSIFPDLETGRPNFDKPHTEAVVHYIKQILRNTSKLNLDKVVLIIAAYAHDWGYSGLFIHGKLAQLEDVKNVKKLHMQNSANKLRLLFKNSGFDFHSPGKSIPFVILIAFCSPGRKAGALMLLVCSYKLLEPGRLC